MEDYSKQTNFVDVPDLKQIFRKILNDKKPYCIMCLRTNDEVRLVQPINFKKYMQATKINEHGILQLQGSLICYVCEQKSKSALMFYRSVMFSNKVKLILKVLINKNVISEYEIFEDKSFKKLLASVGLSQSLSLGDVQNEVQYTRYNSYLSRSDMVTIDTTDVNITKLKLRPIAPKPMGDEKLNTMTKKSTCAIPQHPKPSIITNEVKASTSKAALNNAPEECIVLDDDDEITNSIIPGTSAKPAIEKAAYADATKTFVPIKTAVGNSQDISKKRKKIEEVKRTIKTRNIACKGTEIIDQNNIPIYIHHLPQTNYIYLTGVVPTTNAVIINPNDVTQNNMAAICTKGRGITENKLYVYGDCSQTKASNVNTYDNCHDIPAQEEADTEQKADDSVLRGTLCHSLNSNPKITGVEISDITSDMDLPRNSSKSPQVMRTTDWEDKIPMDVISFVDAVDPNAGPALTPQKCHGVSTPISAIKISEPVSLSERNRSMQNNTHQTVNTDIIDLC